MRLFIAVAVVLWSFGTGSIAEAAAPPDAVSISYDMAFTGPGTASGTWSATGAITDAGTVTEAFTVTPTGQVANITRTLTGSAGTLTLRSTVRLVSLAAGVAVYEGPWHVQSGTARYSELTGEGTFVAHLDLTGAPKFVVNEMDGAVHIR